MPSSNPEWEYRVVATADLETLERRLNELARQGFEVVPVNVDGALLMRRERVHPRAPEKGAFTRPAGYSSRDVK